LPSSLLPYREEPIEFIYRGDVLAGGNFAKATASIVEGEILKTVKNWSGGLSERKVGTFSADLIQVLPPITTAAAAATAFASRHFFLIPCPLQLIHSMTPSSSSTLSLPTIL